MSDPQLTHDAVFLGEIDRLRTVIERQWGYIETLKTSQSSALVNELNTEIDRLRAELATMAKAWQKDAIASEDRGPGTLYARIDGICEFAKARGLCTGIEAKPGELFLMEAFDALSGEAADAEASCDRLRSQYDDIRVLNMQLASNHATIVGDLRKRIEELEENCSQLLSKSDTIKIELDEAGEDGENVRAELRRVSDRCRQIADQYTAMLTRAEQAEARIAVDAGFDAKDARIAELERWAKLYVETLDRAQRAEARVAELEAYLKEDGFNV